MTQLDLKHGGNTLEASLTKFLINQGIKHDIVPSLFFVQLYHESFWGNTPVGRENNNWGGLTWSPSWSEPHTRESGVVVTKGQSRLEGGHYINFKSEEDYFRDYIYLLTDMGIYNVSGQPNFDSAIKGLFQVGGAVYDYADDGYNNYLRKTRQIRKEMNANNNYILDDIDNNPSNYVDGETPKPDPDPPPKPDPDPPVFDLEGASESIIDLFNSRLTLLSKDNYSNNLFTVKKTFNNEIKIDSNSNFKVSLENILKGFDSGKLPSPEPDPDPPPKPDPDPDPDPPSGKKYFPVPNAEGVNFWYPPHDSNIKKNMDYGFRTNGVFHAGFDIGAGYNPNISIHSMVDGTVEAVTYYDGRGYYIIIDHSTDKYKTLYQHLKPNSQVVSVGDTVKAGQKIAMMGSSGGHYDIHLHIELTDKERFVPGRENTIDPKDYLEITADNTTSLPRP